ncbi:MAG: hypothetical protein ABIK89_10915 [Planctomycetota bacterium]
MSNIEDENAGFDEFGLPADELSQPDETFEFEAAGETLPPPDGGGLADMGIPALVADADEAVEKPGKGRKKRGKKPKKAKKERAKRERVKTEGPGFLANLKQTSPYVVLLGISLLALLVGILCLLMELNRYGFEFKPTQAAMPPAVQSGPPSTTATA